MSGPHVRSHSKPAVLVIEDDGRWRQVLAATLAGAGFHVLQASDGLEGLAVYESEGPDAVVTDILMPRCDGLELTRELRLRDPTVPIIAITGAPPTRQGYYLHTAERFGANFVIRKPFLISDLVAELRSLLAARLT